MEVNMKSIIYKLIFKLQKNINDFKNNQDGIGSIEMVLILLVLVGLIVIFRENILNIIESIFDKITTQIDSF